MGSLPREFSLMSTLHGSTLGYIGGVICGQLVRSEVAQSHHIGLGGGGGGSEIHDRVFSLLANRYLTFFNYLVSSGRI